MDGDLSNRGWQVDPAVLGRLMPLHLVLDDAGTVLAHGPTVARLFPGETVLGRRIAEVFEVKASGDGAPARLVGRKLRLVRRLAEGALRLKGVVLPLGDVWVLNLSFGIDLPRAVAFLQLTDGDFAATDLAIELLYLAEANVAVTGELRGLAQRLEGARRQARVEALTDTLTGLKNRRACDSVLARLCREGTAFGLMHMDLDYFKAVNDTLGHAAGDHVLVHVAGVLKANARVQDCIARVGGDEFVMLMPGIIEPAALNQIAGRMIGQLTHPIPYQDQMCRISASCGYVTVTAGQMPDPPAVLADADIALYRAKHAGRGRAVRFEPGMTPDSDPPPR